MKRFNIELTKEDFSKQITEFGFFAEQIPECFNSKTISEHVDMLLQEINIGKAQVKSGKSNATMPVTVSTYKNELSRRVLSIPNPEAFLRLVKLMQNNWSQVKEVAESKQSLSPITTISSYGGTNTEFLNGEKVRNYFWLKSDFIKNIKDCIKIALGYRYRLSVDISNFYNSIYTHSISWAICGKKEAKKYLKSNEPKSLKDSYMFSEKLDAFIRFQKNNETNGIVVGPYTSRIFSEIILASIDKDLAKNGFIFKRYVDDYKFYFRTESQARHSLTLIEKCLNEYNLNLNQSKTEISKFPFDIISDILSKYKDVYNNKGAFGVLNYAGELYNSGEKGAYKYALKFLRKREINLAEFDLIWPILINIMLLNPKYGNYIIQYVKQHINDIDIKTIEIIINEELKNSLANQLQQEILLFLSFIKELNLILTGDNLIEILKTRDDLSLIIALDIWKNANKSVKRTKPEARVINSLIEELFEDLKNESYKGEHWLLLYESKHHKLNPDNKHEYTESESKFFKKMRELEISFYSSVKK